MSDGNCGGIDAKSTWITASCDPTAVKFAGTSGMGPEEVSFAAIVAISSGITVT